MTVSTPKGFKKVLKTLDMTLFTVCAIIVIDTPGIATPVLIGEIMLWWTKR